MKTSTTPMFLIRLSICPCGFNILHDDIKLGTKYDVDLTARSTGLYKCGRCGAVQIIECVSTNSVRRPDQPHQPLPVALFVDYTQSSQVQ